MIYTNSNQQLNTTQKRYEFVAMNWDRMSVEEMASVLKAKEQTIYIMASRMRKHGVPLKLIDPKTTARGIRGKGVDYDSITKLLKT